MARIEKTVFISYRRTDVYTALAVYENLKNQGYDVFFDYRSISSGDFEQIITSNIRARAHFLLILTETALDRCNEPGDWLRREIETAIDEKRNIIPLLFKGFRFGSPSAPEKLTGKLKNLSRYNGLNVHEDYFDEAMHRLRTQFLAIPLNTVLHPVSIEVQKVVREEQIAADKALEQIEDVKEPVKQAEEKTELERLESQAIQYELKGDFWNALQTYYKIKRLDPLFPRVDIKIAELEQEEQLKLKVKVPEGKFEKPTLLRLIGQIAVAMLVAGLSIWGGFKLFNNINRPVSTPGLGIGSTMTGTDGMTLLNVPAGEFTMGSDNGEADEKPVHTVYLNAFWIDQTEVTNAMYSKCVKSSPCKRPSSNMSATQYNYYDNSDFGNYPVIYVSWYDAKAYCDWAGRRLLTEAEWEKAASWDAKNQTKDVYPWGNSAPNNNLLNYNSAVGDTTEVGKYSEGASPYGALNMAGNVWEWVADWYDANYYATLGENAVNPQGPASGQYRVLRGGTWYSNVNNVRSVYRSGDFPSNTEDDVGFRCSRSP